MTQQTPEQIEIERLRGLLDYATDTDSYRRLRALNEGLRAEIVSLRAELSCLRRNRSYT